MSTHPLRSADLRAALANEEIARAEAGVVAAARAHRDAGRALELHTGAGRRGSARRISAPDDDAGQFTGDHTVEATDQVIGAKDALFRADSDWVEFPWPELADLCGTGGLPGAMKPGDIWILAGFSGNGKTLVTTSLIEHWAAAGVKTYAMPLENSPDEFRLYMACQRVGLNPGLVMSGGLRHMAADVRRGWEEKIAAALDATMFDRQYRETLKVKGVDAITARRLQLASEEAVDWGAKILVVDHMDQIDVSGGDSAMAESVRITQASKAFAKRYGLIYLFTSQMNNEAVRGGRDHLAQFGPALPHHLYNGGHKRMIATGIINIHRKLRAPRYGETAKEYTAALALSRSGQAPAMDALEPGVMALTLMKGRNNGEKETQRVFLAVEKGKIHSIAERDRYRTTHGNPRQEL